MRLVRALAAAALALAAALTVAPPAHAAATGTLSVTLVDENGAPMPGGINLLGGGTLGSQAQAVSTWETPLPPGSYAVLAITPWGGFQCAGIDPCDYLAFIGGSPSTPDGSLVVEAGQTTAVTIHGEPPATLAGVGRVGSPLTVDYSDGMQAMVDYLGASPGSGGYAPTVTWLRDGEPIPGAVGTTYTPGPADAGHQVAARTAYLGAAQTLFSQLSGAPVEPRTTGSIGVERVPSKTFLTLVSSKIPVGHRGKSRVDVTSSGLLVTGKVTVQVGSWSQTRSLRNGSALVQLPLLKPGKYTVQASFAGSGAFDPSTAKSRTLTVTK